MTDDEINVAIKNYTINDINRERLQLKLQLAQRNLHQEMLCQHLQKKLRYDTQERKTITQILLSEISIEQFEHFTSSEDVTVDSLSKTIRFHFPILSLESSETSHELPVPEIVRQFTSTKSNNRIKGFDMKLEWFLEKNKMTGRETAE